jgi:NADH:ubiquinone oxidoreductase subunit 2 (subunit N)
MNGPEHQVIVYILSGIAFLSMMAGNLLALLQKDLKRLLAYSSIAHLGYILVALIAGKDSGIEAVTFYMVAYLFTILAAFGIVSAVSRHDREFQQLKITEAFSGNIRPCWQPFLHHHAFPCGDPTDHRIYREILPVVSGVGE